MSHSVEFINSSNGDIIRLEYQHTYNRCSKEFKTTTTEQRPDIVVTITKPNGFVLTYLYDAKYRVQDDKNDGELDEGVDIDLADYPLPDAINQMHRYRDAIYYAMKEDERPRGKEIIGGYILFPGRTEGDAVENRYFYKSIKKVNIGAFPLLPADEEHRQEIIQCDLLKKHLEEILLNTTVYEHIKDSIPQKGLYYSEGEPLCLMVSVAGPENAGYSYELHNGLPCTIKCRNERINGKDMLRVRYIAPVLNNLCIGTYEIRKSKVSIEGKESYIEFEVDNFNRLGEKMINNPLERCVDFSYSDLLTIFKLGDKVQI